VLLSGDTNEKPLSSSSARRPSVPASFFISAAHLLSTWHRFFIPLKRSPLWSWQLSLIVLMYTGMIA